MVTLKAASCKISVGSLVVLTDSHDYTVLCEGDGTGWEYAVCHPAALMPHFVLLVDGIGEIQKGCCQIQGPGAKTAVRVQTSSVTNTAELILYIIL